MARQLPFRPLSIGHIEQRRQQPVADRRAGNQYRADRTILAGDPVLARRHVALSLRDLPHRRVPVLEHPRTVVGIGIGAVPPRIQRRDVGTTIAESPLEAHVDVENRAVLGDVAQRNRGEVEQLPKPLFAPTLGPIRLPPGTPFPRLGQLAPHHRSQSGQIVLHQVVLGTGPHQPGRRLLADRSGNDDEWNVETGIAQDCQCLSGIESGQPVIG